MSDLGIGTLEASSQTASPRRWRGCLAVLVALAVIVAIAAFGYVKGVAALKTWLADPADYPGPGHGSVVVQVHSGDTSADIGGTLLHAHVVKSVAAFAEAAKKDDRSLGIQAGYYRMRLQMSATGALQRMLDPSSLVSDQVTVPEGMRAKEILASVAAHSRFTSKQMDAAFADTSALHLPSYAKGDPEGYLFPATYPLTPGTTPAGLLKAMTATFTDEADSLRLPAGAAALGISPTDVVIVASLVQAEASRPEDMPKVARVIYNRLQIAMPLQFDSALHYAVESRGVVQTSDSLRNLDTPYNTYLRQGLPPTAIDSPGRLALEAALHPAKGSWRYFVTVNLRTGETRFATTYAEHLHNVGLYETYCQTSDAC
ncbi:MAG: endolytic transglycosylase MltG [Nocardioidaceae bacterium]